MKNLILSPLQAPVWAGCLSHFALVSTPKKATVGLPFRILLLPYVLGDGHGGVSLFARMRALEGTTPIRYPFLILPPRRVFGTMDKASVM